MAYLPIQVGSGYLVLEVDVADSPPAAPSGLTATAVSSSRINLAWTDNSDNEAGFVIERSPNGVTGWLSLTPSTAPNATSYSDTGLAAATAYFYRVKATNASGDSAWSNVANATTGSASGLAAPTNLRLASNKGTRATLGWDDNTGGTASTQVEYAEYGGAWGSPYPDTAAPGVTQLFTPDMVEDSRYLWRARATDGLGGIGAWSVVLDAYSSPKQPVGLTIAGKAPRTAVIVWTDVSLAETGYDVRWSVAGLNTWSGATTAANAAVYQITGLTPGTDYDVQVRALGSHSNPSSWLDSVAFSTPAESMPAAPSNARFVAVTPNRLDAHWTRNSTNESYFEVQYAPDVSGSPGTWADAGQTWPEATAHAITGLTSQTAYWTRVRAVNDAGASAWAQSAAALTTPAPNSSPTGREPALAWNTVRQTIMEQMKADYVANPTGETLAIKLQARLEQIASYVGTSNQLASGNGPICAIMYQTTGDAAWGTKGAAILVGNLTTLEPWSDASRENFAELAVLFDWLYPALSPYDRSRCVAAFHTLAQAEIDHFAGGNDSDQVTGGCFGGIALMAHSAAVLDDPTLADYLSHAKVGGLDATGTDLTTARNAVKSFVVNLAAGGEWCESSEYNLGTTRLLALVYASLKTATDPTDHMPEVAALAPDLAIVPLIQLSPAFNQAVQWGDNQNTRTSEWNERVCTLGMLAGLADGSTSARYALKAYHERMVTDAWQGGQVFGRTLWLINPYATETDWRSTLLSHYASGQGTLYVHDGWGTNDSLFFARYEKRSPYVDHSRHYWGGFQLWRKGEWAITNPLGYGTNNEIGEWFSTNAMGVGGLSWFAGYRSIVGQETVDGSHAYIAGDTHGKYYGYTEPVFCNESTRSLVYLPSTTRAMDTIVVFDRVDAVPPLSLSTVNQINSLYYAQDAGHILNSPYGADGLKQWTINAPVQPTIAGDTITWDTAGGQHVRVKSLLPASTTAATYNTSTFLTLGDTDPSERKWQARIKPATDQQWDTFLTVVQVHDGSAPAAPDLIQSSAGQTYQGTRIARSGDNDYVLMFGARANAGNRLITTGTTFGWTQGTASAKVLMFDLDPAKSWTYSLDGGGATSLTISSGGVASLTVGTAAAHTLVLTGA